MTDNMDISGWLQKLATNDPRPTNGVPVNDPDVLDGWDPDSPTRLTQDEVAYQEHKRRMHAAERFRREQLEQSYAGELTGSQEARKDRIKRQVMTREELARLPRPRPLVKGMLFMDSLSWVAGESGSYKSFVTLDIAGRFADEGMDYYGLPMAHGKALIVVGEGNSAYIDRVEAWELYNGRPWPVNAHFHDGALQLNDRDSVAALCAFIKEGGYELVIFDTQAMMTVGAEENSATDMGIVMNALHAVRDACHGCVLTVHHFGKTSSDMRGSGAIYAAATTVVTTHRSGQQVTLSTKHDASGKQKDAKEQEYAPFVMTDVQLAEVDEDGDSRWSLVVTTPDASGWVNGPRSSEPVSLSRKLTLPVLRLLEDKDVFGGSPAELRTWLIEAGYEDRGYDCNRGTVRREIDACHRDGLLAGPKTALKITAKAIEALAEHGQGDGFEDQQDRNEP